MAACVRRRALKWSCVGRPLYWYYVYVYVDATTQVVFRFFLANSYSLYPYKLFHCNIFFDCSCLLRVLLWIPPMVLPAILKTTRCAWRSLNGNWCHCYMETNSCCNLLSSHTPIIETSSNQETSNKSFSRRRCPTLCYLTEKYYELRFILVQVVMM